jgi:leader peptidase (prepilin peptidase) / N-methyltransferase
VGHRRCGSQTLIPLWAMTAFGAVAGAIAGSFIGAWTWRWPRGISIVHGRSVCDHCAQVLRPFELVPIISYWALGRRCSSCKTPIAARQWWIEIACAIVGAMTLLIAPWPIAVAGAVFGWLLLALAVVDFEFLKLPNQMTAALAATGMASGMVATEPAMIDRIIGGSAGFLLLWAIARLYRIWRGRDGMGGGDPKLLGAIGCWLGWQDLPVVLFGASLAGLILVVLDIARGRQVSAMSQLPFGALMAAAAFPVWMFRNGWLNLPAA